MSARKALLLGKRSNRESTAPPTEEKQPKQPKLPPPANPVTLETATHYLIFTKFSRANVHEPNSYNRVEFNVDQKPMKQLAPGFSGTPDEELSITWHKCFSVCGMTTIFGCKTRLDAAFVTFVTQKSLKAMGIEPEEYVISRKL